MWHHSQNNTRNWLMVVNLEKSFSMKYCSMVKKILTILYTCLKKNVYYVFLVLKRSQCKFKQKETILKQGNTLKSKSNIHQIKNRLGCFHLHPLPGLYTEPTGGLLTHGRIFSPSIILKYSPIKICSEDTENASTLQKKKDYFPWFGIQKHLKSLRPSSFALMGCWKSL